jgi:hypothetical protein
MGEFRSPPSVKNARLRIRSLLKQADLSHFWTENRAVVRTFEQCDIVVLLSLNLWGFERKMLGNDFVRTGFKPQKRLFYSQSQPFYEERPA